MLLKYNWEIYFKKFEKRIKQENHFTDWQVFLCNFTVYNLEWKTSDRTIVKCSLLTIREHTRGNLVKKKSARNEVVNSRTLWSAHQNGQLKEVGDWSVLYWRSHLRSTRTFNILLIIYPRAGTIVKLKAIHSVSSHLENSMITIFVTVLKKYNDRTCVYNPLTVYPCGLSLNPFTLNSLQL